MSTWKNETNTNANRQPDKNKTTISRRSQGLKFNPHCFYTRPSRTRIIIQTKTTLWLKKNLSSQVETSRAPYYAIANNYEAIFSISGRLNYHQRNEIRNKITLAPMMQFQTHPS
ncbi:unnamed protein product [Macrosiphum euphorbiae]|uniref:Uncharacterized protein n=1 Tax=Macrosiphum euphorbiae TaxID=13131 RepID=A0AAV0XG40_9HEMI|nr:unnamed protein product [Macrosiphum euphorbiae]